jgi:hypothetical protein
VPNRPARLTAQPPGGGAAGGHVGECLAAWDAEVAELGTVASIGAPVSGQADARAVVVSVPVRFERGELTLVVSVIATGELAGLQLDPQLAADVGDWLTASALSSGPA